MEEQCMDVKDKACVDECRVDCIYEGGCSTSTPTNASTVELASPCARSRGPSAKTTCPGSGPSSPPKTPNSSTRSAPPGGAAKTDPLPYDTDYVAAYVTGR